MARAEPGEALPDPSTFRLAVLVGSASFADALASGQLASEVEWIRQADAAGRPCSASATGRASWRTRSAARSTPPRGPIAVGRSSRRPFRTGSRPDRGSPGSTTSSPRQTRPRSLARTGLGPRRSGPGATSASSSIPRHADCDPAAGAHIRVGFRGVALIDVLKPDAGAAEVRSRRLIEAFAAAADAMAPMRDGTPRRQPTDRLSRFRTRPLDERDENPTTSAPAVRIAVRLAARPVWKQFLELQLLRIDRICFGETCTKSSLPVQHKVC